MRTRDPRSGGAQGVGGRYNAWRSGPHAHGNATRHVVDGRRAEGRGQREPSNDPRNNQHSPNTPTTGLRECGNDTSRSTGRSSRQNAATRRNMRRGERVTVQGPVKEPRPDGMSRTGRGGGGGHRAQGTGAGWPSAPPQTPQNTRTVPSGPAMVPSRCTAWAPKWRWGPPLGMGHPPTSVAIRWGVGGGGGRLSLSQTDACIPHTSGPHRCIGREGASEAAPEAVRQAVGGRCRSGWGAVTVGYKCH